MQVFRCSAFARKGLVTGMGQPQCNEDQFAAELDPQSKHGHAHQEHAALLCMSLHWTRDPTDLPIHPPVRTGRRRALYQGHAMD